MVVTFLSTDNYDTTKYYPGNMIVSLKTVTVSMFRDIGLSVTSMFGGRQTLMESRVDKLLKEVFIDMENKASMAGSDTVIGVRIVMQNIEDQEKPYFTIVVYGTPIVPFRETPTRKSHKKVD